MTLEVIPVRGDLWEMENPEQASMFYVLVVSTKKLKTQKRNSYYEYDMLGY